MEKTETDRQTNIEGERVQLEPEKEGDSFLI